MARTSATVRFCLAFCSASRKLGMKMAATMPATAIATSRQPPAIAAMTTIFSVRSGFAGPPGTAPPTGWPQEPQ